MLWVEESRAPNREMVHLFLSEPALDDRVDGDVAKKTISFLEKLESIIWSVITSGGRYEARLWLCNTISCIRSITPRNQCDLFLELLKSKPFKKDVAAQLVRMIFDKQPEKVGPIIAKKVYMLEKFFEGNPKRILQWFDNFAGAGELGHKRGARALSQFAFVNRDICWEELEWKGKHGQSPAIVATKPHYFYDLDVLRTVENFLEYVPDFWSSNELAESVKDGEILQIDTNYFVDQFVSLMYDDNLEDIWMVIEEFLKEEQLSFLSQRLLILLDEHELLTFLKSLSIFLSAEIQCKDFGHPSCWLENILRSCIDCITPVELYLLNAVINQGRHLLRLMGEEDHKEDKQKIEELLRTAVTSSDADHRAFISECTKMEQKVAVKWIGLQSWALHYCLSKECNTQESCESLLIRNGISFRRVNEYSLMQSDRSLKGYGSDTDDEDLNRHGRKKRKRERKKRRKNYSHGGSNTDELLKFEASNGWLGLDLGGGWLLSTDNYSSTWHMADLPEYLSRCCFLTWMKWVSLKQ